jgi:hypothetical protein
MIALWGLTMKNQFRLAVIVVVTLLLVTNCNFITVIEPTSTPQPTPTLQSGAPDYGWSLFAGDGVEIWLPDTFIGGNPRTDSHQIAADIEALSTDQGAFIDTIEQNISVFNFIAFDTTDFDNSTLTNLNISLIQDVGDSSVTDFIDLSMSQFPEEYSVQETGLTTLSGNEAGYIVVIVDSSQDDCTCKVNIVKIDNDMWVITYISTSEDYSYWQPIFDQSLQTFTVIPQIDPVTSQSRGIAVPEGWLEYAGEYYSLWMPASFEMADPANDFNLIMDSLANYAPVMVESARETPNEFPFNFDLVAVDRTSQADLSPTVVLYLSSISAYDDIAEDSFNELADQTGSDLYEFIQQEFTTIAGYEAFRRVIREDVNGVDTYAVVYIVKEDRTVIAVVFTVSADTYDELVPTFDQIIQTLTVLPR